MVNKHLDGLGKGEHTYDYTNDVLLFKIKNRNYRKSIEFQNLVVDIDKEGFITGLRIFDASKVLGLNKISLKSIKEFKFDTRVENKVITIKLNFIAMRRNKPLVKYGQDFVREALNSKVKDSEVICTVA